MFPQQLHDLLYSHRHTERRNGNLERNETAVRGSQNQNKSRVTRSGLVISLSPPPPPAVLECRPAEAPRSAAPLQSSRSVYAHLPVPVATSRASLFPFASPPPPHSPPVMAMADTRRQTPTNDDSLGNARMNRSHSDRR